MRPEICKFSHNSSLIIEGEKITIVGGDFDVTHVFRTHRNNLSNPVFIDECKVHAIGENGSVYEISARGHREIAESLTIGQKS